jgi:hypothetical protein
VASLETDETGMFYFEKFVFGLGIWATLTFLVSIIPITECT